MRDPTAQRGFRFPSMTPVRRPSTPPRAVLLALALVCADVGPAMAQARLRLGDLPALLSERNRSIRAANAELEVARSEVRRVDVAPNPVVTAQAFNTTAGRLRAPEVDQLLRIDQPIERGGKRALRVDAAQALRGAAEFDLADAVRMQRGAAVVAFLDLVQAREQRQLAAENAAGFARLVEAAERRLRAGDVAAVDVARLRVESLRAEQDLGAAEAGIAQARWILATLLGLEAKVTELQPAEPLPAPEQAFATLEPVFEPRASGWQGGAPTGSAATQAAERAAERRADVRAAEARQRAAEHAADLARSQRIRDISFGVQTERAPSFGGRVFGASVSVPLFLGNDFSGDIARAVAQRDAAAAALERARAQARAEVERAALAHEASRERALQLQRRALPQAQSAAEAIEFAFARGAATLTDLFDARRALLAVRAEALAAQADCARTAAALHAAMQVEPLQ